MRKSFLTAALALTALIGAPLVSRAAAQPPVPQPFPSADGPSTSRQPPRQQPPAAQAQPPAAATDRAQKPAAPPAVVPPQDEEAGLASKLGIPVYPAAQFLGSYDAGRGQRYYLFGSTAPFTDLVAYYKSVLKQRGNMVFDTPATYEFDTGQFDEDTMAFPPGVTLKDYQSPVSAGYPNPKPGGQPATFPTVIQIVPPPSPPAGR